MLVRNFSISGLILFFSPILIAGSVVSEDEAVSFRVGADPMNFPFSNRQLEGFENKIADLIAKELGTTPRYVWWGQRRGFIRNTMKATLKESRCDVVMGVPKGYDLVSWTKPYYRSSYVFVYPEGKDFDINTLDDPILRELKIGVHLLGNDYMNPPPAHELGRRGIVENVIGYDTFYSEDNPPSTIIDAVVKGDIDVAIVWGPIGGYFAKEEKTPLKIVPVPTGENDLPLTFEICLGVRHGENAFKAQLEEILERKHVEIQKILVDYGVPLIPIN
jgi:quinoprotein dehydrogenase-associated probable ABC transporter substrate-binding protein